MFLVSNSQKIDLMLPSVHYPLICRQLHLCLGLPKSLPLIYRSIILAVSGNYLVASGLKLALRARAVLNGNYKLEAHTLLTRIMICVFTRSALCAQPLLCAAQRAFEAASQNIYHTHTNAARIFHIGLKRAALSDNKK
jgi:hypothetical protein